MYISCFTGGVLFGVITVIVGLRKVSQ